MPLRIQRGSDGSATSLSVLSGARGCCWSAACMAPAAEASNLFDSLSLDLLYDGEKLVQLLVEHWQIVGVLWLAVNCGVFLLLAQFHLFRKRKQRDPSAPEKAE